MKTLENISDEIWLKRLDEVFDGDNKPYCEAQTGGTLCGKPVEEWGDLCPEHRGDAIQDEDRGLGDE